MTTTTQYGSISNYYPTGGSMELTPIVADYLGEYTADYDLPGLVNAYRDAINDAMPDGVTLCGESDIYGPYPIGDTASDDIREAIESVDLGALAEQYDRTAD